MQRFGKLLVLVIAIVSVGLLAGTARAAFYTWSGAGSDNHFDNDDNWVESGHPGFKSSIQYQGTATAAIDTTDMDGRYRSGTQDIHFDTAGWTIKDNSTGNNGGFRWDDNDSDGSADILSQGAGVNTIDTVFNVNGGPEPIIEVGAGNTLAFTGDFHVGSSMTVRGDGKMVVAGDSESGANYNAIWNVGGTATVLVNSLQQNGRSLSSSSPAFGPNTTLGGTGGFIGYQYQGSYYNGATIAPGGDGTYGNEIGSFSFNVNDDSLRHNVYWQGGTTLEVQLGDTVGVNDQVQINLNANGTVHLDDAMLNIVADGSTPAGSYTVIDDPGSDSKAIDGTFTDVTLNGQPFDESNYSIAYNDDSTVLTIIAIPEPASLAVFGVGGALVLTRRRRRSA